MQEIYFLEADSQTSILLTISMAFLRALSFFINQRAFLILLTKIDSISSDICGEGDIGSSTDVKRFCNPLPVPLYSVCPSLFESAVTSD